MSSPIHRDEHTDPAWIYPPRWPRERILPAAEHAFRARPRTPATREPRSRKVKPKFSGDRAMLELQRQLALGPDLIPEPLSEGAAVIRPLLIRLCSVTSLAVLVAWSAVSYSGAKKVPGNIATETSAPAISSNHINLAEVQRSQLRPSLPRTTDGFIPIDKPPPAAVVTADTQAGMPVTRSVTRSAASDAAAMGPAPSQGANSPRTLRLDSEEVETLIKRGNDFLASGDLAAARLLLRRAAEAGSAEAALTLGTTFDPIVLRHLGAIGAAPDLAKARQWYQRAAELGSSAASQHLAGLGDVH